MLGLALLNTPLSWKQGTRENNARAHYALSPQPEQPLSLRNIEFKLRLTGPRKARPS